MRRALLIVLASGALAHAQTPDVERAKQLYTAAQQAMTEGRFADAARDFGGAYEITHDPVLFFKIGSANEKAGKCDVALIYYGRYLKEANPPPDFVTATKQRIAACGGNPDPEPRPEIVPLPERTEPPQVDTTPHVPAAEQPPPPAPAPLRGRHQGPWLLVGGSIAMLTVGVVLAYSANASENDLSDLYVGLEGNPPVFDERTKKRYDDLIAEGERYEKLSWISFGAAAALAGGAAVWFVLSRDDSETKPIIAPTVREHGAGVSATLRW
jgi:hypothetical protein